MSLSSRAGCCGGWLQSWKRGLRGLSAGCCRYVGSVPGNSEWELKMTWDSRKELPSLHQGLSDIDPIYLSPLLIMPAALPLVWHCSCGSAQAALTSYNSSPLAWESRWNLKSMGPALQSSEKPPPRAWYYLVPPRNSTYSCAVFFFPSRVFRKS